MGNVLVILGAGASYDCVWRSEVGIDKKWRPPLADQLFSDEYLETRRKYASVASLAQQLNAELRLPGRDENFEVLLARLAANPTRQRRMQFREVPAYLRDLLGHVSRAYTTEAPSCYTRLFGQLLDAGVGKVAFVTLNYDTLLERAIAEADGEPFSMDWYTQHDEWMVIKLHGSVNWGRRIVQYPKEIRWGPGMRNVSAGPDVYLELLRNIDDLEECTSDVVEIMLGNPETNWMRNEPYYPVLAVPVENKLQPVCPQAHLEALGSFLPLCTDVLAIGVSWRDKDLIDILNEGLPDNANFLYVGWDDEYEECLDRFRAAVPHVPAARPTDFSPANGFSDFIEGGALAKFISRARS
ncbi:MAG: SIR2 family protein [Dehalococcoidia bacterium]